MRHFLIVRMSKVLVGVGPRQVSDIGWNSVESTLQNRSIMHFLEAKKQLFVRVYGKGESHCTARRRQEECEGYHVQEGPVPYNAIFGDRKGDIGPQKAYFWNTNVE